MRQKGRENSDKKCKKQELSIEQIMKEIDDDHILVQEEPCKRKCPRIGDEYQVMLLK